MNRLILFSYFIFTSVFIFGQTTEVCGTVGDPTGDCPGFSGVTIKITNTNDDLLCETTTTSGGTYCCTINVSDFPIKICPEVECPFDTSAVATLDLAIIQRFILGYEFMKDSPQTPWPPYFRLWADANGDGKVTASDISYLRKLILGVTTSNEMCRIISKKCKLQYGDDPYNYELCLNGCEWIGNEWINTIHSGQVDFELFSIGDVDNSANDYGCSKPLQNEGGEQYFRTPNLKSLLYTLNPDNSHSIGFVNNELLNMVCFSINIGNLDYDDFIFPIKYAEYIIKDGIIHISYFSDNKSQFINVKEILTIKGEIDISQTDIDNSIYLDHQGNIFEVKNIISATNNIKSNADIIESSGNLIVNFDEDISVDNISSIRIFNPYGALILQGNYQIDKYRNRLEINNINIPSGLYILTAYNDKSNVLLSKKFMFLNR